jgi:uncharacterized cupin superfamily protein
MPPSISTEILKLSVADAAVEPAPLAPEDIVSGAPEAYATVLWRSADGTLSNGVWHCTPGTFYLALPDETVTFIEGSATLTPEGGKPISLAAGDLGFIPGGTRVLWEVHETVRKAFFLHNPGAANQGDDAR